MALRIEDDWAEHEQWSRIDEDARGVEQARAVAEAAAAARTLGLRELERIAVPRRNGCNTANALPYSNLKTRVRVLLSALQHSRVSQQIWTAVIPTECCSVAVQRSAQTRPGPPPHAATRPSTPPLNGRCHGAREELDL